MSGLSIEQLLSGGVITNYHCDLCTEIRSFLFHRQPGRFPEISPEGFYAERSFR
jgi:hypothetical protein